MATKDQGHAVMAGSSPAVNEVTDQQHATESPRSVIAAQSITQRITDKRCRATTTSKGKMTAADLDEDLYWDEEGRPINVSESNDCNKARTDQFVFRGFS